MKKFILDLKVRETVAVGKQAVLLRLTADERLRVSAIIEQMDSTTIVLSNQKATVDEYLNMMIERK